MVTMKITLTSPERAILWQAIYNAIYNAQDYLRITQDEPTRHFLQTEIETLNLLLSKFQLDTFAAPVKLIRP